MEENVFDSPQMSDSFVCTVFHPPIGVSIVILEIRTLRLRKAKRLTKDGPVTVGQSQDWNPGP